MMKGYWNRPELNDAAFYFPPLPDKQEKFYRTGDLVKRNEKDQLVFLGRNDRQVKVRGYRVELDEVESAFASHELVHEAVAIVSQDQQGMAIIVAAITLFEPGGLSENELIAYGKSKLPKYASPGRVEIMDVFPRISSSKIDRLKIASIIG